MSGRQSWRTVVAANPSPMTLDGTRTQVVGRWRPAVIDPGPADAEHLARLRQLLAGSTPVAILLTHHHPDHAAAAPALAAATGAPILLAPGALDVGFPRVEAHGEVEDGEVFETDAGPVRAVATPGHAPEHTAYLWTGPGAAEGGVLFVGDLLMGVGDTTLISPPEGDLEAYLASLRRVVELRPSLLVPAHGPPLDDPPAALARYLRHREERLAQVLAVLGRAGRLRVAELVERVYEPELDARLRPAAAASLQAMLKLLCDQDRVRVDVEAGEWYLPVQEPGEAAELPSNEACTDR
jgi:glyoxylase-like metal-dependent hydrolase (beta-lactamase superfamily II)